MFTLDPAFFHTPSTTLQPFLSNSSILSFIHPLQSIRQVFSYSKQPPFNPSFPIHLFIYLFILSIHLTSFFMYSFIYSSYQSTWQVFSCIHSFSHSSYQSTWQVFSFIHSFIYSFINPLYKFFHAFIHSFILSIHLTSFFIYSSLEIFILIIYCCHLILNCLKYKPFYNVNYVSSKMDLFSFQKWIISYLYSSVNTFNYLSVGSSPVFIYFVMLNVCELSYK